MKKASFGSLSLKGMAEGKSHGRQTSYYAMPFEDYMGICPFCPGWEKIHHRKKGQSDDHIEFYDLRVKVKKWC